MAGGGPHLKQWLDQNVQQLQGLTRLVRGDLKKLQRMSIGALAIQDVHSRDIVQNLVEENVSSLTSFMWQQQLKYYWEMDTSNHLAKNHRNEVRIRQVDANIPFGYEYQGATTRLVITPLTDRCWLTITGALHIKLGAAPAGPAGTGKTESTKDLAKALARRCVVFNCSDQIDYKMIGSLYSGVVSSGSWTCLDEFNRIDIEVLSVIAQQLQTIRAAQLANKTVFDFEDRRALALKPNCGVFITMNPGYAGRTELPDNLKVLFRPVSMMVPDYTLIAEIMLFSEGFGDAKKLSGKFTKLYKLSSEQLSKQDHYDFGMRAVKSVLVMAGALKRDMPDMAEDLVLIQAMKDSNIPKFLSHDLPLFEAIVKDLFPDSKLREADKSELTNAIDEAFDEQRLVRHEHLNKKVVQLFETFNVRFGVMLVGPTCSGKSTCYQTLAKAMTNLRVKHNSRNQAYQEVEFKSLNPKCVTMGELYGENNSAGEWQHGLASNIMRHYTEDESEKRRWTVFDGPVDALWIENMNTVLDDNMTLCLANSERIKLRPQMRMLFEVQDLAVASPATVSRCGMVYMQATDLGYDSFVTRWIRTHQLPVMQRDSSKSLVEMLFSTHVKPSIEFLRRNCVEPVTTQDNALVYSLCNLFDSIINPEAGSPNGACSVDAGTEEQPAQAFDINTLDDKEASKRLTMVFAFCLLWTIGGSTDAPSREKFAQHVSMLFSEQIAYPRSCFECFVDLKEGRMRPWDEIKTQFAFNPQASYFDLIVPSIDTTRYAYVLDRSINAKKSLFLSGPTGSGKSVIIQWLLETLKKRQQVIPAYITFSAQTRSDAIQKSIESRFKPLGQKLTSPACPVVLYVDDVNMPSVEEYGAQPPIELLRQMQDQGGLYSRGQWVFRHIENSTLLLSAAPPGGGRADLTPRFVRHSHVVCMTAASSESMTQIFDSIMSSYFQHHGFKPEVTQMARATVESTIEVFERICKELLPTPSRSHYTFNLRDVSKVVQGILQVKPRYCATVDKLACLWTHEMMRVFHDRLINDEDRQWFFSACGKLLGARFKQQDEEAFFKNDRLVMWGDFIQRDNYAEVDKLEKAMEFMDRACSAYNSEPTLAPMPLVFFKDAVEHVSRIVRILRQPRGNAMLVGVGGSGKCSMTRLAVHMYDMEMREIVIIKDYGVNAFRDDVKEAMRAAAGGKGHPCVFFLTDSQIVNETFLEDINNILNSGEVPNLWTPDEVDENYMEIEELARMASVPDQSRDGVLNWFVQRVRENMHCVLSMSPVGEKLRIRMRMFPSLVNCTTIDWFKPWPADALFSVARKLVGGIEQLSQEHRDAVVNLCVDVHLSVQVQADKFLERLRRHVYISPKSYLDLINLYKVIMEERSESLNVHRSRLKTGLTKLDKTKEDIKQLKEDLKIMEPQIKKAREEAEVLLQDVTKAKGLAEKDQARVEKVKTEVMEKKAIAEGIATRAQAAFDRAEPALREAEHAANNIPKEAMTEMRSMRTPHERIVKVCGTLCYLFDMKPTEWQLCLSRYGSNLAKSFDKDNISQKAINAFKKYIEEEPRPEDLVGVSVAAAGVAKLIHGLYSFCVESKNIAPIKAELEVANEGLEKEQKRLDEANAELQIVLDKISAMERQLNETTERKAQLEADMQLTEARLIRAEKLINGLASASDSWMKTVDSLNVSIVNLVGDAFLAAASISYYGPFTGQYRDTLVRRWQKQCAKNSLPSSPQYRMADVLSDALEIRDWNLKGLPSDEVSINNALLVTRARRWPLMIDPQTQANKWLKNMFPKNHKACKPTTAKLEKFVDASLRNGVVFIYEDVRETIEPLFEPILAMGANSGEKMLHFNDQEVDLDPAFRFYATTKLANPHYLPELCIKVTIINFTVTLEGLEQQLLGEIVDLEASELSAKNKESIFEVAKGNKDLAQLAEDILARLAAADSGLIDDEGFIEMLEISAETAREVEEKKKEAEVTTKQVEELRTAYKDVATRGSLLYFVIADLANVNSMYQFSLSFFTVLLTNNIRDTQGRDMGKSKAERVASLRGSITETLFNNVCRGLFEADKLVFAFMIASQLLRVEEKTITGAEWSFLLRGPGARESSMKVPPVPRESIEENQWFALWMLQSIVPDQKLADLCSMIANNAGNEWDSWMRSADPHVRPLPDNLEEKRKISYFQKMLIIRAVRDEKIAFALARLVRQVLGNQFVDHKLATMEDVYKDSSKFTPVVFILSAGADPTDQLRKYADEKGRPIASISLGQGQEGPAIAAINSGAKRGEWVLLQNCHLAKSFMPRLELAVDDLPNRSAKDPVHEDFRLFLTSMPKDYFPAPILQNSVKLTTEPPSGFKANLRRSLVTMWEEDGIPATPADNKRGAPGDESDELDRITKKLRFGLMNFHAIVQERKKFGPLGWNVRYEFNDSDLETSMTVLRNMLRPLMDSGLSAEDRDALKKADDMLLAIRDPEEAGDRLVGLLQHYQSTDPDFLDEILSRGDQLRSKAKPKGSILKLVPFDTLLFVVGQINYGGRVTDDLDRRCLMAILSNILRPEMLSDNYAFSADPRFVSPPVGSLASYAAYIEGLPQEDPPEVFGMHSNADISFQRQRSVQLLETVLSVQPREAPASSKKDENDEDVDYTKPKEVKPAEKKPRGRQAVEEVVEEVASNEPLTPDGEVLKTVEWLLSELPKKLTKDGAHPSTFRFRGDVLESLATCLTQEMDRFNVLLKRILRSCEQLKRAVKGEVIMSKDLDIMYSAFLQNKVPSVWSSVSYPSLKPLSSWFADLKLRVQFLREWILLGKPKTFWISAFFFPQGFLTGVLQGYSRRKIIPIDILSFAFDVLTKHERRDVEKAQAKLLAQLNPSAVAEDAEEEEKNKKKKDDATTAPVEEEDGCVLRGMFMDGAKWSESKHQLVDQEIGKTLEPAPLIRLTPVQNAKPDPKKYEMPLYKTSVRAGTLSTTGHSTNFVLSIEMPSDKPPAYWVLQGAALLSMKDD